MDSPSASLETVTAREEPSGDRAAELLAEAVSRLSAHTSALNSIALRILAIEGCLAELRTGLSRAAQPEGPRWRGSLPRESISKTLAAVPQIRLLSIYGAKGNEEMHELALLGSWARLAEASAIFEFTTLDGRTAVNLAANCAAGGTVFTLDSPSEAGKQVSRLRYEGTSFEASVVQLRGDSAKFDFNRFYGTIDFVFIGGGDKYEIVMNETRIALQLLRGGRGTIAWRGYSHETNAVARALEELHATEPKLAGMRHVEETELVYARVGQPRSTS